MRKLYLIFVVLCMLLSTTLLSDTYLHADDPCLTEIVSTLKSIPPEFRQARYTSWVQSVSDKEAKEKGFMEPGLLGITYYKTSHVYLLREEAKKHHWSLRSVLCHEYGHVVWFDMLTEEERSSYLHIWLAETINNQNPTDYGGSSPEEGFAESTRLLWTHNGHRNPEEDAFIYQVQKRLSKEVP